MLPYTAPSPFQTSTPGESLLVESSIVLEAPGIHKLAVTSVTSGPSTTTPTVPKSEYITLPSKDLYPSATNGVDITAAPLKAYRVCRDELIRWLKATGKDVSAIIVPSRAATPIPCSMASSVAAIPECGDASSVYPGNDLGGTSSDLIPIFQSKEVRFDQGLWALKSMSKSIFIKAYLDGAAEESHEELCARVDRLLEDLGDDGGVEGAEGDGESTSECHDYAGGKADFLASSYILIDVLNNLDGDRSGYLQIQRLDEGHVGDSEVAHTGTCFPDTCSA